PSAAAARLLPPTGASPSADAPTDSHNLRAMIKIVRKLNHNSMALRLEQIYRAGKLPAQVFPQRLLPVIRIIGQHLFFGAQAGEKSEADSAVGANSLAVDLRVTANQVP